MKIKMYQAHNLYILIVAILSFLVIPSNGDNSGPNESIQTVSKDFELLLSKLVKVVPSFQMFTLTRSILNSFLPTPTII